ncbi:basic form of pathogenesis protein 1 [Sarocladium strictum]
MKLAATLGCFALLCTGGLSQSDDAIKAVAMINQARQARGLQPLAWHPDLATYAQFWADRMGSNQEPFHHASGQLRPSQGETLYQEQSTQCDPAYDTPLQSAVNDWLGQAPLYTGQPITTGQEPWLHFSQCMWSQTTHIGCGRAFSISEPYKFFDVCRFLPEGNIIGQRPF